MISLTQLLTFAGAAFVLIAVPGPSVLFVVSRALTLGRKAAIAAVIGNAVGVYVIVVAVAFGVGELVERSAVLFAVLKIFGAAYLVYLGVRTIRHRKKMSELVVPPAGRVVWRDSFLVGISNPKAVVFFAAVLPQFVDRSAGAVPAQMLLLGLVFVAIALVSDSAWGLAAAAARAWFERSPKRLEVIGGVGGTALIGLGVTVALTGRKD